MINIRELAQASEFKQLISIPLQLASQFNLALSLCGSHKACNEKNLQARSLNPVFEQFADTDNVMSAEEFLAARNQSTGAGQLILQKISEFYFQDVKTPGSPFSSERY